MITGVACLVFHALAGLLVLEGVYFLHVEVQGL